MTEPLTAHYQRTLDVMDMGKGTAEGWVPCSIYMDHASVTVDGPSGKTDGIILSLPSLHISSASFSYMVAPTLPRHHAQAQIVQGSHTLNLLRGQTLRMYVTGKALGEGRAL